MIVLAERYQSAAFGQEWMLLGVTVFFPWLGLIYLLIELSKKSRSKLVS